MIENELIEEDVPKKSLVSKLVFALLLTALIFALVLSFFYWQLGKAPSEFTVNSVVTIEPGESVREITQKMEDANVVRSSTLLYLVISLHFEPEKIKASTYVFEGPVSVYEVAERLAQGDFDSNLLRFTHIEGERATTIAKNAAELLPNFDAETFLQLTESSEGHLFPDTYFIPESYTAEELANLMLSTFDLSIEQYMEEILSHSLSLEEIIVLASIIEREANSPESMNTVSAILQNRLAINMPLQADASIEYVLDKPLNELTPEDLKVDSPYNTYLNLGLPPTAIGNPGLAAIEAVLRPAENDYLYYITDENGVFHYSRTYREHQSNIELYLR